jgi:hypothetical protein
MKFLKTISLLLFIACLPAKAVDLNKANRDPKYVEMIVERSKKIVDKLGVGSTEVAENVTNMVANRYFELNDIYEARDAKVKRAKENLQGDAKKESVKAAENEKDAALYKTHFAFPANLSIFLDKNQLEAVKDGITFGVLKVTYEATLDMVPTLKEDEKKQIYAWLVEAREIALDAETSNKKHEVFGRYKGRINNYLSKRGYDLVKEREAWYKRIEERKEKEMKK